MKKMFIYLLLILNIIIASYAAVDAGFNLYSTPIDGSDLNVMGASFNGDKQTVLGFSFKGDVIPAGCGTLLALDLNQKATGLSKIIMAGPNGKAINFENFKNTDENDDILKGCDLPDFNLYLNNSGEVLYNSSLDIAGIQFDVDGANILKINMGESESMVAKIETTKGEILIELEFKKTPMTVANFVGLAEGTIKNDAKPLGEPYYDGIKFHRVIDNFMIQGGDPTGTGRGGPGYQFVDEFHPDLNHSGPGILSMANSGPGTNGSQFFITHVATPWLDGKHTVFGHVTKGQDIVDAIEQDDKIVKVTIIRNNIDFDAPKIFEESQITAKKIAEEKRKKEKEEMDKLSAEFKNYLEDAQTTASGLKYVIIKEGTGDKPQPNQTVSVHYAGYLMNGQKFDSSFDRNQPIEFPIGAGRVIKGWDEGIMMLNVGTKARLIIPPELGYGARGAGGVIPPNATLVFDVELMEIK